MSMNKSTYALASVAFIAAVGLIMLGSGPAAFASVLGGCTGDPHDGDSGPTGNPHDPSGKTSSGFESGNPHDIIKSHLGEGDICPGS
jgi:hypothetical protein